MLIPANVDVFLVDVLVTSYPKPDGTWGSIIIEYYGTDDGDMITLYSDDAGFRKRM